MARGRRPELDRARAGHIAPFALDVQEVAAHAADDDDAERGRMLPSRDAVASSHLRAENATLVIGSVLPRANARKRPGRLLGPAAQIPALDGPALAIQRPSGLNETPLTNAVWRRSVATDWNERMLQTRTS